MLALLPLVLLAGAPAPSRVLEHKDSVRDIALSPDGSVLAVSSGESVFLYDSATGARKGELSGHAANVYGCRQAPTARSGSGTRPPARRSA